LGGFTPGVVGNRRRRIVTKNQEDTPVIASSRIASSQSAERLKPFIFLIVGLVVMTIFGSLSQVVTLGAARAAAFWIIEASLVTLSLLWICPRFKWPTDSWKAFVLKHLSVAVICSFALVGPSFLLDIPFGLTDILHSAHASFPDLMEMLAYEILLEAAVLFAPCLLIITAINWLTQAGPFGVAPERVDEADQLAGAPAIAENKTPLFWSKLERRRHGRLLALEAQQHYINVHTTVGSELIKYGFGDAVQELRHWEGAQIHRSFWVARSAITDIVVDGRKSVAVLSNGLEVPISRNRKEGALTRFAP